MAKPEEEEQQHLSTLDDLEATQEEIASYQKLLIDIPEIYERKFNERLKPILERRQELLEEREQLIHQIHRSLPAGEEQATLLLKAPSTPPSETEAADLPPPSAIKRMLGLLAVVIVGLSAGFLLSRRQVPSSPTPVSPLPSPMVPSQNLPENQSLRNSEPSLRNRVVDQAISEWVFFGKPLMQEGILIRRGKDEGDDGQWQRISTYWRDGVLNTSILSREDATNAENPWSAVFLSYIMKKAGAGDRFPYSSQHAAYIKDAIHNKMRPSPEGSFIGHRPLDYAPRPGDMICATRLWAQHEVTYDNVADYDFFPSRCELVIGSTDKQIDVIGGDRMNSVMGQQLKAVNGKLAPEDAKSWLVVIETRLD